MVYRIDREKILFYLGGDEELMKQVLETFLITTPALMENIRTAIEEQNSDSLYRSAHKIKGALGYFNALEVNDPFPALEEIAKNGQWEKSKAAQERAEQNIKQLTEDLRLLIE